MSGPEHYKRAEQLEQLAILQWERDQPLWQLTMQQAQVHATLALAAATAEPWLYETNERTGEDIHDDWLEALR